VVFRELLAREEPPLQWRSLFRALRLMELSGEVVAGRYFEGPPGLQFATPAALRQLRGGVRGDGPVFWHAALDPASLCGLGMEALRGRLPRRVEGTRLVWRGDKLAMAVLRRGRALDIFLDPGDPDLPQVYEALRQPLERSFQPMPRLLVETVNSQPAAASPYLPSLEAAFRLRREPKGLALEAARLPIGLKIDNDSQ